MENDTEGAERGARPPCCTGLGELAMASWAPGVWVGAMEERGTALGLGQCQLDDVLRSRWGCGCAAVLSLCPGFAGPRAACSRSCEFHRNRRMVPWFCTVVFPHYCFTLDLCVLRHRICTHPTYRCQTLPWPVWHTGFGGASPVFGWHSAHPLHPEPVAQQ